MRGPSRAGGEAPTGGGSGRIQGAGKYCLRQGLREPYRKPTQVGRMSNLRRASDLALRNSAKCTRNFGRSVAHGRNDSERQKAGPGDCLPKTQPSANQQWDV